MFFIYMYIHTHIYICSVATHEHWISFKVVKRQVSDIEPDIALLEDISPRDKKNIEEMMSSVPDNYLLLGSTSSTPEIWGF